MLKTRMICIFIYKPVNQCKEVLVIWNQWTHSPGATLQSTANEFIIIFLIVNWITWVTINLDKIVHDVLSCYQFFCNSEVSENQSATHTLSSPSPHLTPTSWKLMTWFCLSREELQETSTSVKRKHCAADNLNSLGLRTAWVWVRRRVWKNTCRGNRSMNGLQWINSLLPRHGRMILASRSVHLWLEMCPYVKEGKRFALHFRHTFGSSSHHCKRKQNNSVYHKVILYGLWPCLAGAASGVFFPRKLNSIMHKEMRLTNKVFCKRR